MKDPNPASWNKMGLLFVLDICMYNGCLYIGAFYIYFNIRCKRASPKKPSCSWDSSSTDMCTSVWQYDNVFHLSGYQQPQSSYFDGKHLKVRTPSLVTHLARALCITSCHFWKRKRPIVWARRQNEGVNSFFRISPAYSQFVLHSLLHRVSLCVHLFPFSLLYFLLWLLHFTAITSLTRVLANAGRRKQEDVWGPAKTGRSLACYSLPLNSLCLCADALEINNKCQWKRGWELTFGSMTVKTFCLLHHEGNFIQATLKPQELWNGSWRQKMLLSLLFLPLFTLYHLYHI